MQPSDTPLRPVTFHPEIPAIRYIVQTRLPEEYRVDSIATVNSLVDAIKCLDIRGAPALGVAGAYGVALATLTSTTSDPEIFQQEVSAAADLLRSTRPTAVNLFYGINRVLTVVKQEKTITSARDRAVSEAENVADEDSRTCHAIGEHGRKVLPLSCRILTHCNAGALACSEWGTALGVIRSAVQAGTLVQVYACETRPLLQGARLTAWELAQDGIDVTVITDSMAASLMRKGMIDLVVVGADRITGDAVFNKIGTYMHAICAHAHEIPFYVAAPFSTFDEESVEADIIVEERSRDEIAYFGGRRTIPDTVNVYNPAFDATPVSLVTGIITEHGIFTLPDDLAEIRAIRKRSLQQDHDISL
ncbi:S-methyl-5-thioribose-1-phosphate isomerase [Methanospirillum lacunae]|uniref:Putative methylthioribose-1-phosphate isomerase n=1 Tax=Methanospirillum lacunae TaxID=668570 RepID=A0A2V2N5Z1_9EURY|nr:S-methyl-5-thioribose-1-phosphate isomerase [Methanospirillum lacunae]PWR74020.1 S-methyl-5-thioribose-1-phosphate isomerase [Methanospirillum lacunae]